MPFERRREDRVTQIGQKRREAMEMDRRKFLKVIGMAGAVSGMPLRALAREFAPRPLWAVSPSLRKFIQPLPALGTDIPVATPNKVRFPGVDYYQIGMRQFRQQLHPSLPNPTKLWGYYDLTNPVHKHLGGVIVAQEGTPVRIRFKNKLPPVSPLPVDTSLPGAETGQAQNRTAVHLHGGFVSWTSDGGPFAWFLPDGTGGPDWFNRDYYYPNQQSARLMWYHDHAMGITRLNAYAGLATGYLVQDAAEARMVQDNMIPSRQIPLIVQDKVFKTEFDQWGRPGDLWYPSLYDTARWPWQPGGARPPVPSCVPEFSGDTMLVNGVVYPFADVEPRRYRFRLLNACQTRFLRLRLVFAQSATFPGSTEPDLANPGPSFLQIGTEGGFLARHRGVRRNFMLLGAAERADFIVDFSAVPVGSKLIFYNDAPSPFPGGDPLNDFHPGNPLTPQSIPGFGPNSRTLMQFRVVPLQGAQDPTPPPLRLPNPSPPLLWDWEAGAPRPGVTVAGTRDLTLNEDFDSFGRLVARMGTNVPLHPPSFGMNYLDPPTETPLVGTVEIWRIFNLTGDAHPWHFHLTNVQIISRQRFDAANYNGTPTFTGPVRMPDQQEQGWKETVRMNPSDCTTVILKFDLPAGADPTFPGGIPLSTRTGVTGHEYVQHCHILEHEEHDMMRPLIVVP
jgi:spore coat protein A, manganese oxidase